MWHYCKMGRCYCLYFQLLPICSSAILPKFHYLTILIFAQNINLCGIEHLLQTVTWMIHEYMAEVHFYSPVLFSCSIRFLTSQVVVKDKLTLTNQELIILSQKLGWLLVAINICITFYFFNYLLVVSYFLSRN